MLRVGIEKKRRLKKYFFAFLEEYFVLFPVLLDIAFIPLEPCNARKYASYICILPVYTIKSELSMETGSGKR